MLTIEDITGFFVENASYKSGQTPQEDTQNIPIIESWIDVEKDGIAVIRGKLYGHPQHPLGVSMTTSTIQRYFGGAGHVYVKTRNSLYELGQPLKELELPDETSDFQALAKKTIWHC
ncbi:hypothetical protein [Acaryochloris marina]|uniref:Uncharacterized protein n=1 Tax=Acaryochloris marina (strain MBIC 11017) TaxID=329726 RepID=A8ZM47_ACAM1|nr:hypothetical protein [Acaryochloris marina]ABW31816.1 hypothetical protein AM1_B0090 [Acaryochloris marina MBIC11017]